MTGWFSMKRGITSHALFKGHPERLAIWVWLLDNVAWKDTQTDVNGKTVAIPRGSVSVASRRIADETGVSHQTVRTFLDRLKAEAMINTRVTQGRTIISLTNWDRYQQPESGPNTRGNTPVTHDQHTKETREQLSPSERVSPSQSVTPTLSPPSAATVRRTKPKAERFNEFWDAAYPHLERKIARGKCEAKYRALVAAGVDEAVIIGGARAYAKTQRVQEGKVCNPLTWLNQRRWEDEAADVIPLHPRPPTKPNNPRTKSNDRLSAWLDAAREPGMAGGPDRDPPQALLRG